jgi:outer membrane protein assembly factor BamD (BamD/ComL family)
MFRKKSIAAILIVLSTAALGAAQGPARGRIDPPRDPVLEVQAKHNLEVARWYLNKRKAYEGARDRLKEILDTYPDFSRIDEVIYLLGEAHMKLGKNEVAAEYYNRLVKDYPSSELVKKAEARLDELKQ